MLPDFKILLIDSAPGVRESLAPLAGLAGPMAILECHAGLDGALAALRREDPPERAALAMVPMVDWEGRDPAAVCGALLEAAPDLPVILTGPEVPEAWRQWVNDHPAAPRLLVMPLPLNLNALRMLGGAVARTRRSSPESPRLLAAADTPKSVEALSNDLRHSEERFAAAFRAAPYPQAILNFATGQFVEANAAFCQLTGFAQEDLLGHSMAALQATGLLEVLRGAHPLVASAVTCRHRSGEVRHLTLSTQPTALGGDSHLMLLAQDVTERVQLEQQLQQAQKLGAMGQLAAGVAHDFNNILTIIQGHLSLQLENRDIDPAVRSALRETLEASEHAATLTRQLLALSRYQLFEPAPLDLNALVQRMSTLLQRLIGGHIGVEWHCESGLPCIVGDAPGIEQVVMHLVLQARDAMPRGGRLRIATGLCRISASKAALNPEAREGEFVRFSIVDSGHGMDQRTVARLLGAFADLRSAVPDTGPVLAAVYAIIKQHHGWIELFSDPGQGTAFFVYLPVTSQSPVDPKPALTRAMPAGLTVLLVEDEPAVRAILRQLLIHCGCTVLEAPDAPSALTVWASEKARIQLLITDIVMPGGMNGQELATRLTNDRPELKVIYSSGYSASLFQEGEGLVAGRNFLPKPYDASSVVSLIRRVTAESHEILTA